MKLVNQFSINGALEGRDIMKTKRGNEFAVIKIEVDEQYEDKQGQIRGNMAYYPVTIWDSKLVEEAKKLEAGAFVFASGKINSNEYNGRHYVQLTAQEFHAIDEEKETGF